MVQFFYMVAVIEPHTIAHKDEQQEDYGQYDQPFTIDGILKEGRHRCSVLGQKQRCKTPPIREENPMLDVDKIVDGNANQRGQNRGQA